jgi:hypothetical protein
MRDFNPTYDRSGSKARITALQHFCPLHLNEQTPTGGGFTTLCANSRPEQVQQTEQAYSITSSAVASSVDGTVRPNVLAVSALMTSSNLLACMTGRSAGFVPLRMWPA